MTPTPEQQRREEIAGRAEAATEGPWEPSNKNALQEWGLYRVGDHWSLRLTQADATFIAQAREDIPWLLDQLERAQARERGLREALADLIHRQDTSIGQPSIRIEDWHREALAATESAQAEGERVGWVDGDEDLHPERDDASA